MTRIIMRRLIVPALLLGWLGSVGPAAAVFPPPVKDEAKFFKPETLEKAARRIRDIYREFYKDVVIETFPAIPADLENKFKEEGKNRFFAEWADRRLEELGVNGVYILIVRAPGHLQVTENKQTRVKQFTRKDENKLVQKMLSSFKEKKYDEGLLDALDFVQSTLKANRGK